MTQFRNNYSRPYYRAGFTGWFRGLFSQTIPTSPGQVTGSFVTASVSTKFAVASVEGDYKTATVSSKSKFLVKE